MCFCIPTSVIKVYIKYRGENANFIAAAISGKGRRTKVVVGALGVGGGEWQGRKKLYYPCFKDKQNRCEANWSKC